MRLQMSAKGNQKLPRSPSGSRTVTVRSDAVYLLPEAIVMLTTDIRCKPIQGGFHQSTAGE